MPNTTFGKSLKKNVQVFKMFENTQKLRTTMLVLGEIFYAVSLRKHPHILSKDVSCACNVAFQSHGIFTDKNNWFLSLVQGHMELGEARTTDVISSAPQLFTEELHILKRLELVPMRVRELADDILGLRAPHVADL